MFLTEQEKQYLDGLYEENIALLKQLGRIPAPSHHEEKRAAFVRDWFLREGEEQVRIDPMKNAVAELNCDAGGPVRIFAAHTDVVFDVFDELPVHEEGSRLYAPGIGDDTANLVNLLMAYKCMKRFHPEKMKGIVIAANACEEGLGNLDGTKELMRFYAGRTRCFISFDGHIGQCCSGAVGSHRYELSVSAKGGHSYGDFGAPSAILQAADLIRDLYDQELPGGMKTTMNVGTIRGGTTVNSIAQHAVMTYEYRSESENNLSFMKNSLESILQRKREEGQDISCKVIGIRPGFCFDDTTELDRITDRNAAIMAEYNGGRTDRSAFSTDSNIPLSMGIPANTIGTVTGEGSHTTEEWIEMPAQITGMYIAAEVMKGLLQEEA